MSVESVSALIILIFGLLVGWGINHLSFKIPAALEAQALDHAYEFLGLQQPSAPLLLVHGRSSAVRLGATVLVSEVLTVWAVQHFGLSWNALAVLPLCWGLLLLSLIDIDHQLLPDSLVLPMLWLGLLTNNSGAFVSLHDALWGVVAGYLFLGAFRVLSKLMIGQYGIGYGDVKLLALLGAWGGWQILPSTLVIASSACWIIALVRADRTLAVSFGPYLAGAGWLSLLYMPN